VYFVVECNNIDESVMSFRSRMFPNGWSIVAAMQSYVDWKGTGIYAGERKRRARERENIVK